MATVLKGSRFLFVGPPFKRRALNTRHFPPTLASALHPTSLRDRRRWLLRAKPLHTTNPQSLPCSPHELHFPRPFPRAILSSLTPEPTSSLPASPNPFVGLLADSRNHSSFTHLICHSPKSSPLAGRTLSFSPPLSLVGVELWLLGGPCLLLRPPTIPPGPPRPPPSLWKAECSLGWKVESTLGMALAPLPM